MERSFSVSKFTFHSEIEENDENEFRQYADRREGGKRTQTRCSRCLKPCCHDHTAAVLCTDCFSSLDTMME